MLLIYTLKKVFKRSPSFEIVAVLKRQLFKIKYIIPFFLLSNTSPDNADAVADVEKISFSVIKKNSSIGFIDIEKTSIDETTTYIINSEVKAKVIFNFNVIGIEKYIYKSDTLIYSSLYRKLNNKVKLNQSLSLVDGKYFLKEKNKNEVLDFNIINSNLVTLFFFEPVGIQEIFSDKYKKMVNITPFGKGKYKVVLPNKSTSIYHYENGKCTTIDVVGSFYKVKLIQI
ncbi:MAG: hypothetical protein DRI75_10450 [Bacteroidetes bacterium]|nr:MAG: hypothetical protein DRI75_10450 [Bacteroidota bacterium]